MNARSETDITYKSERGSGKDGQKRDEDKWGCEMLTNYFLESDRFIFQAFRTATGIFAKVTLVPHF